jgi:hypothetical protein
MGVSGQRHAPADLYRRLGGPQGRSERVWKISPPTGIRSPDRPDLSESLYRLWHPSPLRKSEINLKILSARMVTRITFRTKADKHDVQAYKIRPTWRPSFVHPSYIFYSVKLVVIMKWEEHGRKLSSSG